VKSKNFNRHIEAARKLPKKILWIWQIERNINVINLLKENSKENDF